jgi:pimeloyl-ACP methyl ester carboxylesterase
MRAHPGAERRIDLPAGGGERVSGDLVVPAGAAGIVVFVHGSGSGRLSSRNRRVAAGLQEAGFATLLFDLLTPAEEEADARTGHLRFDIPFLARRLGDVAAWVAEQSDLARLPVGYFGASTGAAAALVAAAERPVAAIVSRGGRPDLAGDALERVDAPTLLIVGSLDVPVIEMNREAYGRLRASQKQMVIVPGASHLFEEPGALEEVARLAADWFERHLHPA